jgi:hypothetical protein
VTGMPIGSESEGDRIGMTVEQRGLNFND